jgi:hypothetical protein
MLKINAAQVVVSTFKSDTPKAEDTHAVRYSVTIGLMPDEHKKLVKRLEALQSHMVGASFEAASHLVGKEHDRAPSTHSGLVYIDCWGDDNSFSGLVLNNSLFPYEDPDPPRNLVLPNCEVALSCRVMTKKDKSVVLAWTAFEINTVGLEPQKESNGKDKKR